MICVPTYDTKPLNYFIFKNHIGLVILSINYTYFGFSMAYLTNQQRITELYFC